jgi:hypothetical protein
MASAEVWRIMALNALGVLRVNIFSLPGFTGKRGLVMGQNFYSLQGFRHVAQPAQDAVCKLTASSACHLSMSRLGSRACSYRCKGNHTNHSASILGPYLPYPQKRAMH